jgi:ABC-type ATPase with predicted acetyltransferase domain
MTPLHLHRRVETAVPPSPRVDEVAAMFGLGQDTTRTLDIVPPTDLALHAGQVVFVTGPSGSGKSTLLRLIAEQLPAPQRIDLDDIAIDADRPLVELWDEPLPDTLRRLSTVGLADAFVMLRRPRELSDGQRFRLRLAAALHEAEQRLHDALLTVAPLVILADEFCATLDRPTAIVIASSLAKWARRAMVCLILATTHDDLLEPLDPDTLIAQQLGGTLEVHVR